MDIYKENIIDHYKNPRNKGSIEDADYIEHEVNTLCGDALKFYFKLDEKKERIIDVKFEGEGCAISQATASMLTEEIKGMSLAELKEKAKKDFILDLLGVEINPARLKCALLSLECVKKIYNKK